MNACASPATPSSSFASARAAIARLQPYLSLPLRIFQKSFLKSSFDTAGRTFVFVSIIDTASMSSFIAKILYAVSFEASGESVHPVCSIQLDIKSY